jgi:signal peptidase I
MKKKQIASSAEQKETAAEGFSSICSVLAVVLFALTFVFQNFVIPSSSMASTLITGDHVVVERENLAPAARWAPFLHYRDVQRGDVIVFYKPAEEHNGKHSFMVKRVIGLPGDHIHLRKGIVYLNGVAQVEPQAAKPDAGFYDPYVNDFPSVGPRSEPEVTPEWALTLREHIEGEDLVVPAGHYFAMGDNRTNSLDSRFFGFIPRENIIGRPLFVYWSIPMPEAGPGEQPMSEQAGTTLHDLVHFFDQTRWSRTFHPIR